MPQSLKLHLGMHLTTQGYPQTVPFQVTPNKTGHCDLLLNHIFSFEGQPNILLLINLRSLEQYQCMHLTIPGQPQQKLGHCDLLLQISTWYLLFQESPDIQNSASAAPNHSRSSPTKLSHCVLIGEKVPGNQIFSFWGKPHTCILFLIIQTLKQYQCMLLTTRSPPIKKGYCDLLSRKSTTYSVF